jgi:P2-related tail formation protein
VTLTDLLTPESVTITREATGSYKAIVELSTTASTIYEKWTNPSTASMVFFSGSIDVNQRVASNTNKENQYVINITNLQDKYSPSETSRFRLYTRLKDWSPTIYTVANTDIETEIIKNAYYKVFRVVDNLDIIDFGTGSVEYTKLSYDKDGSYFDLDINMFEQGYAYGIQFSFFISGKYENQPEIFKFRVE